MCFYDAVLTFDLGKRMSGETRSSLRTGKGKAALLAWQGLIPYCAWRRIGCPGRRRCVDMRETERSGFWRFARNPKKLPRNIALVGARARAGQWWTGCNNRGTGVEKTKATRQQG
eukprot:2469790-Amphidinium_carterae.1